MKIKNSSFSQKRRNFLVTSAGVSGAFVLGVTVKPDVAVAVNNYGPELTHWILIDPDETVTVRIARTELGQGTFTGLAQMVAEELECDWRNVKSEYADVNMHIHRDRIFKSMSTGGSRGIRDSQDYIRKAGAAARIMLIRAAAKRWNVPESECMTQNGVISNGSGKTITYGQIALSACEESIPTDISLKPLSDWRIMGTSPARFDIPEKTNGQQIYASDFLLPGMLHASILQCPVWGGTLKSVDETKISSLAGIKKIVKDQSWVAVIADNWWRANEALKRLPVSWDITDNQNVSNESISELLRTGINDESSPVAREDGNVKDAFQNAAQIVDAEYSSGYLNHATMEPQTTAALFTTERLDVWSGTQNGEGTAAAAAETVGIDLKKVFVHKFHAGGGFGRRVAHQDFTKQAVKIAKSLPGTPVRLQWSREEDMRHGKYRPVSLVKLKGALDLEGNWLGWHVRQADQSIMITVRPSAIKDGVDPVNTRCFKDNPYTVSNYTNEYAMRNTHVPPGFWRAVAHTNNPFAREGFIDELAHAAKKDPYLFRRQYLQGTKDLEVLDAVAAAINWEQKNKSGFGRGIAVVDAYGSYTASAVELSVDKDKKIDIRRIVVAINCGNVVHPDSVKGQIEGGVVWALSSLMHEEINIKDGKAVESNFTDYKVLKLAETPEVEAIVMPSGDFWGGVGEPPISAIIPAVANAIFQATGERVRQMPISKLGFSFHT